jgi:hypothetical protein
VYIGPADSVERAHNCDHKSPWYKSLVYGVFIVTGGISAQHRAICGGGGMRKTSLLSWKSVRKS